MLRKLSEAIKKGKVRSAEHGFLRIIQGFKAKKVWDGLMEAKTVSLSSAQMMNTHAQPADETCFCKSL